MRVGYATWSLDVELGWNAQYDAECITITPALNDGAFQLSSSIKRDGYVTDEEIAQQVALKAVSGIEASKVAFGKFRGLMTSYVSDAVLWRWFWLAHGQVLVLATYNGPTERAPFHAAAVLRMLATLEPEHDAA